MLRVSMEDRKKNYSKKHGSQRTEKGWGESIRQPLAVLDGQRDGKSTGVRASDGQSRGNCCAVWNVFWWGFCVISAVGEHQD